MALAYDPILPAVEVILQVLSRSNVSKIFICLLRMQIRFNQSSNQTCREVVADNREP